MIKSINKFYVFKFVSSITMAALLLVVFAPLVANAAVVTSSKATFGRIKASTDADSVVVQFVTPTGIQTGGADTITLTFSSDFTLAAEAAANFDVGLGDSGTCSSATYTDEIVALAPSATDWGVDVTGQVITFSPETDDTLTAGFCIRFEMGLAATTGGTGAADTVANGAADDDDTITIGGVFGDTGTITVDIVDDDQVTISANVNQALTFDLDTGVSDGETSAPYAVALGTITVTDTRVSGTTDSVEMIIAEADTNAPGGLIVTVQNANGSNGLVSGSDNINSAAGTMADGTENYGICVITVGLTGFTVGTTYSGNTCATNSESNDVETLTTTPVEILNSGGAPVASAHAEISVNAAVSGVTAAHSDYADTLTFIATGTF